MPRRDLRALKRNLEKPYPPKAPINVEIMAVAEETTKLFAKYTAKGYSDHMLM
jgi:hypothetical protein